MQLRQCNDDDVDESRHRFACLLSDRASRLAERIQKPPAMSDEQKPESSVWEGRSERVQDRLLTEAGEVMDALWNAWDLESEFGAKTYGIKANPPRKSSLSF